MTRLAATVLAVLMLVLTAFAGHDCRAPEPEDAVTLSMASAAVQAADALCRAPAMADKTELSAALAALDKQADHEDPVEMMAVEALDLRPPAPLASQALPPGLPAPEPWLPGLLRPPRALHA